MEPIFFFFEIRMLFSSQVSDLGVHFGGSLYPPLVTLVISWDSYHTSCAKKSSPPPPPPPAFLLSCIRCIILQIYGTCVYKLHSRLLASRYRKHGSMSTRKSRTWCVNILWNLTDCIVIICSLCMHAQQRRKDVLPNLMEPVTQELLQ